ncbi:MAG: hypothetical protein HOB17_12380 [Candidatus Marinimicrobia bacterium]|nr:hypothetical protein [Bacteroidota bacterium]MBT5530356.1 hypothetical protein [Cytophagia bacterium]MBT6714705.1 hypothetical protein [Candidatus Neomarinimicrobiota bacterium]
MRNLKEPKEYSLTSKFDFGKFKGKTLNEVLETHRSYIKWSILNVGHFFINEKSIKKIADKCGIAEDVCRLTEHDMNVYKRQINQYEYNDWDNRYKGTRARDEGGLSDECIDEALDGDPSNYINLE